jgi:hypothetical protein
MTDTGVLTLAGVACEAALLLLFKGMGSEHA